MIRIGIIGAESSHAAAFADMLNVPDPDTGRFRYEDARVVGVCGPDERSARELRERTPVDFVAASPEEFFGKVDAVMVTARRGSEHSGYALPFIRRGIPVFIDKPFTSEYAGARELIREAGRRRVPLCGGSGCKYAPDVLALKDEADRLSGEGKLVTGWMNFTADLDSVYDGFYFYAPHLTEMALTVFGPDMRRVRAFEKNGSLTVVASYDRYDVTLAYTKGTAAADCLLVTPKRNLYRTVGIGGIYRLELEKFLTMVRTGAMPGNYESLVRPVAVMNAIMESCRAQKECAVVMEKGE